MIDWKNLGFEYMDTNGYVVSDYREGRWGKLEFKKNPYFEMHIASQCFHYGQACFEGIKAFRTKNGEAVIFRPGMSAKRMAVSADRTCMESPPEDLFLEACKEAVKKNIEFLPPYGTGASMYLRPVLFATEPVIGVRPSREYKFIVFAIPVGPYYKHGFSPVKAVVIEEYDRAAPNGTGATKMAGNYAAGLKPERIAKERGFPIVLYLDAKEKKYVDEFGTSNFFGITKNKEYKTPLSESILPSITNDSLQTLAKEIGLKVVKEKILVESLGQFSEVGACGTAAVVTPVSSVTYGKRVFSFGEEDKAGETLVLLYSMLQNIRYGEIEDKYGWLVRVG